ncbi:MAG TPA: arginine--tRNA ligase [Bacteroidales bacterium]|nr:arginine--tRNA ligase [Bacteroidales bacterium]HOX75168.1 arginine--tRNA ligase [Bacteroidales bacterium]HQM68911.1 arginine--tRNA ligase [Bacteroidales bacterium]
MKPGTQMESVLRTGIKEAVRKLYNGEVTDELIQIQETRKDFKGDFTIVVFPLLRFSKNTPEKTAETIGKYLMGSFPSISGFNVIKGFLNLEISDKWWVDYLADMVSDKNLMKKCHSGKSETILVEYSSPNTNKPLHLGHVRNNLLGFSLYRILSACGHKVIRTNIVNDRGIHICKSMLAWQKFGMGETPESSGMKGDHLVGTYYVLFEKEYRKQADDLISGGMDPAEAKNNAPLMKEAREMLLKWEAGDPDTIDLWKRMNSWVYAGFDETYKRLGVDFDKIYYESDTYKLGRDLVYDALEKGLLNKNGDNSIWVDLTAEGLDQKLLLRSDGTAVYMTQDIGTAALRYEEHKFNRCIYVVGNEQNYHFQVLKAVLKKMGYPWSDGLFHFSYGMVELPEGKMKSREGIVVDADDLITEMIETAKEVSLELGKLSDYSDEESREIFRMIGMGALKYFILKVDPRKNMTFNPAESIDFNGNTGPFIQYTYTRIRSVFRKAGQMKVSVSASFNPDVKAGPKEIQLIRLLRRFTATVIEAADGYSPAIIANYCYELAREYNQFYHDFSILGEPDPSVRDLRLVISEVTGRILKQGMDLLGIEMPERM